LGSPQQTNVQLLPSPDSGFENHNCMEFQQMQQQVETVKQQISEWKKTLTRTNLPSSDSEQLNHQFDLLSSAIAEVHRILSK